MKRCEFNERDSNSAIQNNLDGGVRTWRLTKPPRDGAPAWVGRAFVPYVAAFNKAEPLTLMTADFFFSQSDALLIIRPEALRSLRTQRTVLDF